MPTKKVKVTKGDKKQEVFVFRVKLGDREVELRGTHEEVTRTIENLPILVANINKAFEVTKPKTVATITVKTEQPPKKAAKAEASKQSYPKISTTKSCGDAVLKFLETEWGKWRPRTTAELKEAMKSNKLKYPGRMLKATLDGLAEKGKVRRWNTNTGFVYILAEEKSSSSRGKSK